MDYFDSPNAWRFATGEDVQAVRLDAILHAERLKIIRDRQRWPAELGTLPTGTFVVRPDQPDATWLFVGKELRRWSHAGYTEQVSLATQTHVGVLTSQSVVRVLQAGYRPVLHPTAETTRVGRKSDAGDAVVEFSECKQETN